MPHVTTLSALTDEVIHTALSNGDKVCVRTIRPSDEQRMRDGIAQLSAQSRYLRFFSGQRMPPDPIVERLIEADGHDHIAWGAILTSDEAKPAIGAVHVFREEAEIRTGEFSVAIVDAYHGLGLARILTAVILINCCVEGITSLDVHMLHENHAAGSLVRSLGGTHLRTTSNVAEYAISTETGLDMLRRQGDHEGLQKVFRQLSGYLETVTKR